MKTMNSHNQWIFRQWMFRGITLTALVFLFGCAPKDPGLFATPEAAVQAVFELIGQDDEASTEAIFGPGSFELFKSGDADADREDGEHVKFLIQTGVVFDDFDENTKIALLGEDEWPFPIPLMREEGGWRFNTAAGREELLNRRIGRNELWVLTSMHEVVDAQREYRSQSRDGNPPAFAQKFRSGEGQRDGLYWPAEEGADLSPLGDLLAESEAAGLHPDPQPFHGYYFRILTSQGDSAPGGARSYLDEAGLLTGGFAVVAWPAKYGNSGVMTFITNHYGLVFEKDLGADTEAAVATIESYDPDTSWTPTGDEMTESDAD
jgi:hypothetical protein